MRHELITIGMTAFNAVNTIERAVISALAQDWPECEIVIVDDASTDDTFSILQRLAIKHPSLRIFRNERNGGVAAARNRLIREAKGNYIAFFDDDDESLPHRIRLQLQRLKLCPHANTVCHTARRQVYPDGWQRIEKTVFYAAGEVVAGRILFNRSISGGSGSLATCSQMAPRAVYEQLGGFDEQFRRAEDTDFCLRLALAGGHFVGINEPLVVQSITYGSDKSLANERFYTLKLYEKHRMALGGRYEFDHGWIEAKYDLLSGQKGLFLRRLGKLAVQHPFMTLHRAFLALPNIGYNKIFSQFYNHKP